MIVSEYFKGDRTDFQWVQHDQYGKAVGIIFEGCRKHYLERFKDDNKNEIVPALENLNSFDHRVLQDFHDHLAAYWRKKYLCADYPVEENIEKWLSWLEVEMGKLKAESRICVAICFLALDKYGKRYENQVLVFLRSYVKKAYPLKWQHYLERISIENTLNMLYAIAFLIFAVVGLYSGLVSYKESPMLTIILGLIFAGGYIFANNQKLHEQCLKNVFVFLIRIAVIFLSTFGIALLLTGLNNFQIGLITNHLAEIVMLMVCVVGLHLIRQLCLTK